MASVAAPDDSTVVFTLRAGNDETWPGILGTSAGPIVDSKVFPADKLLPDEQTVGSGPYKITSYGKNQLVQFEASPNYGGPYKLRGMRQRIMIALALALRPKFIVADEPTTALDVLVEAQILRILADIRVRYAAAILLITHNLGIVAEACDRVAVMYAGKIVEQGPVREIFSTPRHPYTQALLSSTISLTTQALHSIPGAPPDLVDPPPGCRFHPRYPHAMQICATRQPPQFGESGHVADCWLLTDQLTVADRQPLRRMEVAVADEA